MNGIFLFTHKFAPRFCSILADVGLIDDSKVPYKPLHVEPNKHSFTPDQTGDVVNAAPGDFCMVTPPPTPEPERKPMRPAKKARKACSISKPYSSSNSRISFSLPTANDPMDEPFSTTLYSNRDDGRINPVHVVIRREVLKVHRTVSGRVFFQCDHCKHLPRGERAKLSTIAPQKVGSLYQSFVRFLMDHVSACKHIPNHSKGMDVKALRDAKACDTKKYWVMSAKDMGLEDREKRIVYCRPTRN